MDDCVTLATKLAARLQQQDLRLAVAESCTGGWIAKVCTDLAGSSRWFDRGFVTYSNQAKQDMLGVPADLLRDCGAVSQAVVEAMAAGALDHSRAQVSVAVSGIAGPGGGSNDKPVGTVWIGWAGPHGALLSKRFRFQGDRERVRRQAVSAALQGLLDVAD